MAYQFLYMPECSVLSVGRVVLSKINAQITFVVGKIQVHIPEDKAMEAQVIVLQESSLEFEIIEEVENMVTPLMWAAGALRQTRKAKPVTIYLKPKA